MAIRIYGDNQTAGVSIVTTGKGNIKGDGTEAYAQAVTLYDATGTPVSATNGVTTSPALATTKALTSAVISASTSGDNTIVAAAASTTTKVYRMYFVATAAVTVTIKNGAGTSLTGAMPLAANQGIMMDFSQEPWFVTSTNTAFIINLSSAVAINGAIEYIRS